MWPITALGADRCVESQHPPTVDCCQDGDMHAIEVARTGGPEVLSYVERSQPSPGAGEVLIKAEAIGVYP
jgi:hypothetical protein